MSQYARDAKRSAELHGIPWRPKTYESFEALKVAVLAVWPTARYAGSVPPNQYLIDEQGSYVGGCYLPWRQVAIVWWTSHSRGDRVRAVIAKPETP